MNYNVVANTRWRASCDLADVFKALADRFREIRQALNCMSESLINIDDDAHIPLLG